MVLYDVRVEVLSSLACRDERIEAVFKLISGGRMLAQKAQSTNGGNKLSRRTGASKYSSELKFPKEISEG